MHMHTPWYPADWEERDGVFLKKKQEEEYFMPRQAQKKKSKKEKQKQSMVKVCLFVCVCVRACMCACVCLEVHACCVFVSMYVCYLFRDSSK